MSQARADDVVDTLAFEQLEYRLIVKAAIRPQQSDRLATEMMQCGFDELQHIVGTVGIAQTQPEVRYQARIGHKGQQRVMRQPSPFVRVVAACGTLLKSVPGGDGGVHIQSDAAQGTDGIEEPAIDTGLHSLMAQHVEASEQAHDGFVPGDACPAEQPRQGAVHTGDFEVSKTTCPAPD